MSKLAAKGSVDAQAQCGVVMKAPAGTTPTRELKRATSQSGLPLPINYELQTELIKNQTELLIELLKGMRQ